ncbi:MAG: aminotransferase class III-fold pyridoxal phosphate-dependent enzyme [Elusimicrobia bacterium]|nr:aminotransferase class III-fold pyridoxal phosphate-dependent enzyme [Elusimicrobiota bacterium]
MKATPTTGRSQRLYRKAKGFIPGGTQLLSKRPEMFLPDLWPSYYSRARGCELWDLDGRRYLDMSYMGIGAAVLGYADPDVDAAVRRAVSRGNMTTLNAPEEVELAEVLVRLHPWAKMVRYARTGGEAMAMAVRIARASSGRDTVLFCGYHGWHDWYLAANLAKDSALDGHLLPGLEPKGVPKCLRGTSFPFRYNDTDEFLRLAHRHRGRAGVVVMEPIRNKPPEPGFLEAVQRTARQRGMVLVVDEITAGWRLNPGGAHLGMGLEPDIAVFGKAMSNGYPMAAVVGKRGVMQAAQGSFISSTYWTDRIGPSASLACIEKYAALKVHRHLAKTGNAVQDGWRRLAGKHGLRISLDGIAPLGHFGFEGEKALALKTLFTQEMLKRGFLATNAFYASWAHRETHLRRYFAAADRVFGSIAACLARGRDPEKLLSGEVCHAGFRRLI